MTDESADPQTRYEREERARRQAAERDEARARRVSHARLGVFLAALALAFVVFGGGKPLGTVLGALAALFLVLVVFHDRLIRAAAAARRAEGFYRDGLVRLAGRFHELPCADLERDTAEHPYAEDLDCLGPGSLFHRIDAARTRVGKGMLADWLLEGASPAVIRERQAAIAELRPRLQFREALGTLGDELTAAAESEDLVRWSEGAPKTFSSGQRIAARALPSLTLAAGLAWWLGWLPPLGFVLGLAAQAGFAASLRPRVRASIQEIEAASTDLGLLVGLFATVEGEGFEAARLRALQGTLTGREGGAARRLRELQQRIDLLDARRNQFFAPIGGLLLWSTQLAVAIEDWRRLRGGEVRGWIDAFGEMEALLSVSAYAYEQPEHPFPELLDGGPAVFEATGLGHPLLAPAVCVRNDVSLNPATRLILISGSNMSGKSTLLRAIGTNVVLAQAGAPVCAESLRISPLQLGASVQLRDSLLGGQSRFYAEIQRLSRVFELARRESPAGALPAGRDPARHERPGTSSGCGSDGARVDRVRCVRPRDDPRPGAGRHGGTPRHDRAQLPLRGSGGGRRASLRLFATRRRREPGQRVGPDARRGAARLVRRSGDVPAVHYQT